MDGLADWLNSATGRVVIALLIPLAALLGGLVAWFWPRERRAKTTVQAAIQSASYDDVTQVLLVMAWAVIVPPAPGILVTFDPVCDVMIRGSSVPMTLKSNDQHLRRLNTGVLVFEGNTPLIQTTGTDIHVTFQLKAMDGAKHTDRQTIRMTAT